jgi:hypothetical protein
MMALAKVLPGLSCSEASRECTLKTFQRIYSIGRQESGKDSKEENDDV